MCSKFKLWILCVCILPTALVDCLQCHGGIATWAGGKEEYNNVYEQTCAEMPGQSCLTAETEVTINGLQTKVVIGSCANECRSGMRDEGCGEVVATMQMLVDQTDPNSPVEYNVTKCSVSCCHESDFCNRLPGIDLPKPKYSDMMCYGGMRQSNPSRGVWSDDVRPVRCMINDQLGPDTSCLRATITIDGGTEETSGTMLMFQCQPTVVCASFTCDLVMRTLPENVRSIVTDCQTSCCSENLCNRSTNMNTSLLRHIALLMTSLYVSSLLN